MLYPKMEGLSDQKRLLNTEELSDLMRIRMTALPAVTVQLLLAEEQ